MGFTKALLVMIVIPLVGFAVATWVLSGYQVPFGVHDHATVAAFCADPGSVAQHNARRTCERVGHVQLLRSASIGSGAAGVLLLLVFALAAVVAGTDRERITRLFPPLVLTSLVVLSVLILSHGAILTYSVYLTEMALIGQFHIYVIGGVALGALIGGGRLVRSWFSFAARQEHPVLGLALDRTTQPGMFAFISGIATRLGARQPDHIVVGLEPNFYVTSATVKLIGSKDELRGETLYMSLPLARILTRDEIKAVIGHELGHFRGKDTFYSLKFAPVYAGLSHGVAAMQVSGSILDLARLPAKALLEYMIEVFHRNVSEIGRAREFEADRAATEVAPAKALATSLLKIGLYANAWGNLEQTVVARMGQRKMAHNLSSLFASIVKYDVNEDKIPEAIETVAQQTIAHPTDSHPPTAIRIAEAGVTIAELDHALLLVGPDNGIDLVSDYRDIEERLTRLQQQYYVTLGVHVPDKADGDQSGTLIAALGAHMVLADGKVEPAEIDHAEAIGMQMSKSFDFIEFREFCHYPQHTPDIDHLLDAARDISDDGKTAIYRYLQAIASSDDDTSVEEIALLERVSQAFWTDAGQH